MSTPQNSFDVPLTSNLLERDGHLSNAWVWFFRSVFDRLYALGTERSFNLVNNQSTAANIDGLNFDKRGVSQAVIDYTVQRITSGTGAVEEIESGILIAVYKPTSQSWSLIAVSEHNPVDAGITFSITSSGQVQYTTDSVAGTPILSRIFYRARTLAGKSNLYSSQGAK